MLKFTSTLEVHKSCDGVHLFCQPNIHMCCEHIVLFLWNMFKFFGHSQFSGDLCNFERSCVISSSKTNNLIQS